MRQVQAEDRSHPERNQRLTGGRLRQKIALDPLDNAPLTMQLAAALKKAIVKGVWKVGDVLPGIHDLAAECNTSERVPRTVLARLAAEGWVRPQRGVGSVVVDRGESMCEVGRVLMYVRDTGWSYYSAKLVSTLTAHLHTAGYSIATISAGSRSEALACRRLETVLKERWSLVLLLGAGAVARQMVSESGWPFALLGDGAPLPSCTAPGCIGRIEMHIGKALPDFIREAVRRNVRRIVQFVYAEGCFDVTPMLAKAGVAVETVRITRRNTPVDVSQGALNAMRQLLKGKRGGTPPVLPDVFLFSDDYVAQGALLALSAAGVRIPADVKVVTHANKGLGPVWIAPLTRLETNPMAHGRAIAKGVVGYLKTGRFPSGMVLGSIWKPGATF